MRAISIQSCALHFICPPGAKCCSLGFGSCFLHYASMQICSPRMLKHRPPKWCAHTIHGDKPLMNRLPVGFLFEGRFNFLDLVLCLLVVLVTHEIKRSGGLRAPASMRMHHMTHRPRITRTVRVHTQG